jgi:hypothetical protein
LATVGYSWYGDGVNRIPVLLLDRLRFGEKPDYCVHGYVDCGRCFATCWLGSESVEIISSGKANPLCLDCANAIHEAMPDIWGPQNRIGQLHDHRREDGPHT